MHVVYTLADPRQPHGVVFLQRVPFIEVQQCACCNKNPTHLLIVIIH